MNTLLIIVLVVTAAIFVAGALYFVKKRKPRRRSVAPSIPAVRPMTPEQELSSLGIMEIRPKTSTAPAAVDQDDDDEEGTTEMPAAPPEVRVVESEPAAEPKPRPSPAPVAEVPMARSSPSALNDLLQAVRAAVGGHTAGFIKRLEPGRYWIEGLVSESGHVLTEGSFEMDALLDEAALEASTVAVFDVGSAYIPLDGLGYYTGTVAVRQFAVAPVRVPENDGQYALIIDALAWHDLDDPWQRLLIGQFSTLLGTLQASPAPTTEGPIRVRTRREIIAEEMEQARENDQPLALALIHLNRAEDIANRGEHAVGEAEEVLASHIGDATPESRLERFGELTYGVFRPEEVAEVEAWAVRLEDELAQANGVLEGGVSIGIALLRERHGGPDDFREDAHAALREAFETGTCTIIE